MTDGEPTILPVTPERWPDLRALFSARGAPHYCWCMWQRSAEYPHWSNDEKEAAMRRRVKRGTPVGLLAYVDGAPVGWVSVAPRPSYERLQRSRVMGRVEPEERDTWLVLCFFIARKHRGAGLQEALVRAALEYARENGAEVVEGYPERTSSRFYGRRKAFRAAGFRNAGGGRYVAEV